MRRAHRLNMRSAFSLCLTYVKLRAFFSIFPNSDLMMYENASFAVRGSIVALVTPMLENGQLDLPALRALIDWHIAEGSDALVVAGTTGESPALGIDEYQLLMQTSVEQAAGRTPVIASAGRNSTSEAVELA